VYEIIYHKTALKDLEKLKHSNLHTKTKELIDIVRSNPYQNPPPFKRLSRELLGYISRRINIQHRLVYKVLEDERVVQIYRMWSHYE